MSKADKILPIIDEAVVSQLNADRPITSLGEDLLDRGTFCISLATAIKQWDGHESLVIGLYGPWGTGKSSVKNIVLSLLKDRDPAIPIIEFNPWTWSGEDRLIAAFFDEIGAVLPELQGADHGALESKWKSYAARLTLGGTALGHLKTASEFAGIPWVPMILGTLAGGAGSAAKLSEQAAKIHDSATEKPIYKLRYELENELKKLKTPIMVVLDDIDRLTTEEIRLLFRLVKANADFPNLVFLMLFDREIVENALEEHVSSNGRAYMEKIVQVGVDLPKPARERLEKILFSGLDALIGSNPRHMKFDEDRWQSFYLNGLRPFFETLRDIRRFLSSFSFHVGMFVKDNMLEVNMIDLIGIETIRVFEPELYKRLGEDPELVFGNRYAGFSNQRDERDSHKDLVVNWINDAKDRHISGIEEIARCLFPQIDWLLSNHGHGRGFEPGWLRDLRVCHSSVFDRYFSLLIPESDISQSFVDQLLQASSSREQFRGLLLGLETPSKISAALNRFEVYASEVKIENATEVIHAIFDVGETLPDERAGLFGVSADVYAWRIVNEILRKELDVPTRSELAQKCLEETGALWFPCRFVSLEQPDEGEHLSPHRDVFNESTIVPAIQCCLKKIRKAAIDTRIVGERLPYYLWRWHQWSGNSEARDWVADYVRKPNNALAFVVAMTSEVSYSSGNRSGTRKELDFKNIETFVDPDLLEERLAPYFAADVPEQFQASAAEHHEVIRLAKEKFENRQKSAAEPDEEAQESRTEPPVDS